MLLSLALSMVTIAYTEATNLVRTTFCWSQGILAVCSELSPCSQALPQNLPTFLKSVVSVRLLACLLACQMIPPASLELTGVLSVSDGHISCNKQWIISLQQILAARNLHWPGEINAAVKHALFALETNIHVQHMCITTHVHDTLQRCTVFATHSHSCHMLIVHCTAVCRRFVCVMTGPIVMNCLLFMICNLGAKTLCLKLQGTYYSQPQSPSTFYCLGRGLTGPHPGLPTVALNGPDMTDNDCGRCIVLQGTGITAAVSSAAGEGTTPFPAAPSYATIDNQCPECKHCDIDYYTGFTQTSNGRYTISWSYIDCAQAVQLYNAQGNSGRKLLQKSSALRGPSL